jgi:hypothetical protein
MGARGADAGRGPVESARGIGVTVTRVLAQQLILGGVAGALLAGTVALVRRDRLTFAGGVLWFGIGVLGLIGALLVPRIGSVGSLLGVVPAAVFTGSASILLGLIALLLSVQVSGLERSLQDAIESIGLAGLGSALHPADDDDLLVVVPAFNEARSIAGVVAGLRELGLKVLVVSDGSRDRTVAAALGAGASVLDLPANLGVGGALRAGLRYARRQGFSSVITCDADGQHPREAVEALIAQRHQPVDLLIGSRFTASHRLIDGFARQSAIATLSRIASRAAGVRISDSTSGLRLIRRPLLDEICAHIPRHFLGDTFEIVVAAARGGYRIAEVPVTMEARLHGTSTASPASAVGLTIRVLLAATLRVRRPFAAAQSSPGDPT